MEAQPRSGSAGVERLLLSMVELSMVEVVLAAGNSLLSILSAVHCLSSNADDLFKVGEMIKGKPVAPRGDSKVEHVPEDKDSDSENDDDEEDGEDQEAQDDEGENVSGEEGHESEGAEDEDPEANGDGGSDDEDDEEEEEDEDEEDDDDDDDEDDEEEDDDDLPQPPTKKRK